MKGISLILILLSASLGATETCTDLSGKYRCKDLTGKSVTVEVEQEGNEFYLKGVDQLNRVIADGNRHDVSNSNDYRNAAYTAQCKDQGVVARGSGDVVQNGWPIGRAQFTMELRKLSTGGLQISVNGSLQGPLGSIPVRESRKCDLI